METTTSISFIKKSRLFKHCKHLAFLLNENLMPVDCLNILIENYGVRLDYMKPSTIVRMIHEMMMTSTDVVDDDYVNELVQDWCNS
jgi:hypothetical protein